MSELSRWLKSLFTTSKPPQYLIDPVLTQADSCPDYDRSMAQWEGKDICDWVEEVRRLKRSRSYDQALVVARGCMDAMIRNAQLPHNATAVATFYVIQVVIIEHQLHRYADAVNTLESWFATGLPHPRQDHYLELNKRLAKARECLAKQQGRDWQPYHQQWQEWLDKEKAFNQTTSYSSPSPTISQTIKSQTPKSRSTGATSAKRSFIPTPEQLMINEFVAVDFETANRASVSACQIALIKIANGAIVDRYQTLIKPPQDFDDFEFSYLHGIHPQHVHHAPSWQTINQHVHQFVSGLTVFAHNAPFDAKVWRELDSHFGVATYPSQFFCSYYLSRRMLPSLPNHKLPTVVGHCNPAFQLTHHQADSDVEACGHIVNHLILLNRNQLTRS